MYDTIIIGCGISGLACGKTLHENNEDFLLLTKDIGGRMLTSKSHKINYGASYITSDYKNVLPYMGGGKRIWIHNCYFFNKNRWTTFYCWETLRALPRLIKLFFIARDFKKRLRKLRKRAFYESQKKLVEEDPVLKQYIKTSAKSFVKKHKLESLNKIFFNPLFNSTCFIEYDKSNVFFYLDNLMSLFCKTYVADHSHCCAQLSKGWKDKIKKNSIHSVKKSKKGYLVTTGRALYAAKNVVLALPYKEAIKIYKVPKPEHNIPIYVLHIVGERKEPYKDKNVVFFQPDHSITILWKQETGSDIIFSKTLNPKLNDYYDHHRIIRRIHWNTAAVLSGKKWMKQNLDKGLYLASDYNICGLEDAFITGVYAANQIIEKNK